MQRDLQHPEQPKESLWDSRKTKEMTNEATMKELTEA